MPQQDGKISFRDTLKLSPGQRGAYCIGKDKIVTVGRSDALASHRTLKLTIVGILPTTCDTHNQFNTKP